MDRKKFIKSCCIIPGMGLSATSLFLQSCAKSTYFVQAVPDKNILTIKKSAFIKIDKDKTSERAYILVETDQFNFPIGLYKLENNTYSALLMECTHKGCELHPNGSFLVCPCHGSEFSNKGVVQNPPAEENLKSFPVKSDNENIYIQL